VHTIKYRTICFMWYDITF